MSEFSIMLPDSVGERLEYFAREDGVSVDAFVASVLPQVMRSWVRGMAG